MIEYTSPPRQAAIEEKKAAAKAKKDAKASKDAPMKDAKTDKAAAKDGVLFCNVNHAIPVFHGAGESGASFVPVSESQLFVQGIKAGRRERNSDESGEEVGPYGGRGAEGELDLLEPQDESERRQQHAPQAVVGGREQRGDEDEGRSSTFLRLQFHAVCEVCFSP